MGGFLKLQDLGLGDERWRGIWEEWRVWLLGPFLDLLSPPPEVLSCCRTLCLGQKWTSLSCAYCRRPALFALSLSLFLGPQLLQLTTLSPQFSCRFCRMS